MYDRMGDLLSEFLDNGQLPPERKSSDAVTTEETERNENRLEIPVHLCADFARLGFSSESGVPSYSECRRAYKKKLQSKVVNLLYVPVKEEHEYAPHLAGNINLL